MTALGRPSLRLLWLCHAGGTAGTAAAVARQWPAEWDILLPDYPGRGFCAGMSPCATIESMAEYLIDKVVALRDGPPLIVFGHSMGGLVAREYLLRAREGRCSSPAALIVSAVRSPRWFVAERPRTTASDEELVDRMVAIGGTPREVLDDPTVRAVVIRSLRADLRIIDAYVYAPARPLDLPIVGFAGTTDPIAPKLEVSEWARETAGGFDLRSFEGGHFYHFENPAAFLDGLREATEMVLGYR